VRFFFYCPPVPLPLPPCPLFPEHSVVSKGCPFPTPNPSTSPSPLPPPLLSPSPSPLSFPPSGGHGVGLRRSFLSCRSRGCANPPKRAFVYFPRPFLLLNRLDKELPATQAPLLILFRVLARRLKELALTIFFSPPPQTFSVAVRPREVGRFSPPWEFIPTSRPLSNVSLYPFFENPPLPPFRKVLKGDFFPGKIPSGVHYQVSCFFVFQKIEELTVFFVLALSQDLHFMAASPPFLSPQFP